MKQTGDYEKGFAQGEADAFSHAQRGIVQPARPPATTAHERGYQDGYTPRSATWRRRQPQAVTA